MAHPLAFSPAKPYERSNTGPPTPLVTFASGQSNVQSGYQAPSMRQLPNTSADMMASPVQSLMAPSAWYSSHNMPSHSAIPQHQASIVPSAYPTQPPFGHIYSNTGAIPSMIPQLGGVWGGATASLHPSLSALHSAYSSLGLGIGAVGDLTQLIGINTEAIARVILGLTGLAELVGNCVADVAGVLPSPAVKYNEVAVQTTDNAGNLVTGMQQVVSPMEMRRQRRYRLVRWIFGVATMLAVFLVFKTGKKSIKAKVLMTIYVVVGWLMGRRLHGMTKGLLAEVNASVTT